MKSIFKQVIILILLFLISTISFYWLSVVFLKDTPVLNPLIFFLISSLFGITFFVFFSLSSFKFWWQLIICLLNSLLVLIFFKFNNFLAFGIISFFLFSVFAARIVQEEEENLLKIKFFRITQKGIENLLTGFAVLIAVLLFLSPKVVGGELVFSQPLFTVIWPQVEKFFSEQFPGFSGDMTVDDYLLLQIFGSAEEGSLEETEFKTQQFFPLPFSNEKIELEFGEKLQEELRKKIEEELKNISEEERERIEEEMIKQSRDQLSQMVGKELKGDEKIKDVFYEVISAQFSKIVAPYKMPGSIGLIFAFFLVARTIAMLFLYIVLPFSYLIFILFKKLGFFIVRIEKVDKEVITI